MRIDLTERMHDNGGAFELCSDASVELCWRETVRMFPHVANSDEVDILVRVTDFRHKGSRVIRQVPGDWFRAGGEKTYLMFKTRTWLEGHGIDLDQPFWVSARIIVGDDHE